MKVTLKKLMLVLLLALLVGMIGSECYGYNGYTENKGRIGCGKCPAVYWQEESHVCRQSNTIAQETSSYGQAYCSKCNTKYPANLIHSCPLLVKRTIPVARHSVYVPPQSYKDPAIDIDIWVTQRPQRYIIYRQYGGYNNRVYYNLSGRNYPRKWFGDRHHHRDHHYGDYRERGRGYRY
jgi:hypothetical protein